VKQKKKTIVWNCAC